MEGIKSSAGENKGMPAIKVNEDLSNTKKEGQKAPLEKMNYLRLSYQKLMKYFSFHRE